MKVKKASALYLIYIGFKYRKSNKCIPLVFPYLLAGLRSRPNFQRLRLLTFFPSGSGSGICFFLKRLRLRPKTPGADRLRLQLPSPALYLIYIGFKYRESKKCIPRLCWCLFYQPDVPRTLWQGVSAQNTFFPLQRQKTGFQGTCTKASSKHF